MADFLLMGSFGYMQAVCENYRWGTRWGYGNQMDEKKEATFSDSAYTTSG
jgi:hypothetical protein